MFDVGFAELFLLALIGLLVLGPERLPAVARKLGSWIGLIAINTAYDYLRALSRQPASDCLTEASERPSGTEGP